MFSSVLTRINKINIDRPRQAYKKCKCTSETNFQEPQQLCLWRHSCHLWLEIILPIALPMATLGLTCMQQETYMSAGQYLYLVSIYIHSITTLFGGSLQIYFYDHQVSAHLSLGTFIGLVMALYTPIIIIDSELDTPPSAA